MDITNKTYETILVPSRPSPRRSNSEEIPPPLPVKNPARGGPRTKPGKPVQGGRGEAELSAVGIGCVSKPPGQQIWAELAGAWTRAPARGSPGAAAGGSNCDGVIWGS